MSPLDLIPLAWVAVTAFVVAACQVSSRADAQREQAVEREASEDVR